MFISFGIHESEFHGKPEKITQLFNRQLPLTQQRRAVARVGRLNCRGK